MQYSPAYFALADWFEYLNSDCDYDKWSQYLHGELCALGIKGGTGLDLGCGSGYFTRAFTRLGYGMTGFDVSEPMLAKAQRISDEEGVRPRYILCDLLRLKTMGRADFALCVNDCVNYIPQDKLLRVFKKVAGSLRKGGAFLFDISSESKLCGTVGNNTFCEDREEVSYMWFNKLFPDRVEMDFTIFAKRADGLFERGDERHVQYIHTKENITENLLGAGFTLVKTAGALGDESDTERINFICIRN